MTKVFSKTEKQAIATRLQGAYLNVLLFGGSRSGKTYITVRNIIIRALKCRSRHLMLRLNFNHIKRSIVYDTLPKVWANEFAYLGSLQKKLNKTDWFLRLPNGSEIWFGGLDNKERVEKILGTEYSTIYFNESSQIDYESVTTALTRLAEDTPLVKRAYYDCNPPSKRHWSYVLFVEGKDPIDRKPIPDFESEYATLVMNPDDNRANLPQSYFKRLDSLPRKQRERFRDGIFGLDIEGALWTLEMIDQANAVVEEDLWSKRRTLLSIDPAVSNEENSDLWGMVVGSLYKQDKAYIEADHSIKASPDAAIKRAIAVYEQYECDAIVVEVNQGGDMVVDLLRLNGYKGKVLKVRASKGKYARAEPVSALYEQRLIGHAAGLEELEDELTTYVPFNESKSPDRLDALVWLLTELYDIGTNKRIGVL